MTHTDDIFPMLFVTAAPGESRAVAERFGCSAPTDDFLPVLLAEGLWLVQSGVGKVNAAIAAAHIGVAKLNAASLVSLGVAGALPRSGEPVLPLRSVVLATLSVYADEGSQNPDGFVGIDAAGFPPGGRLQQAFSGLGVPASNALNERAWRALGNRTDIHRGPIATVSTCSGTDAMAAAVARRTGALAEAMEGAAIGHAFRRLRGPDAPFTELRVISNPTGDRHKQTWDLRGAFETLGEVAHAFAGSLTRAG